MTRVWLIVGLAVAAISAMTFGIVLYTEHVRHQVLLEIENANRKSEERADKAQHTVDACYLNDGDWDRAAGRCVFSDSPPVRRD